MTGKTPNPTALDPIPEPPHPWSWQRLESAGDCRRFFRWLLLEVKRGRIDPKRANTLAFIGGHLLRAVELADLEARIAALEGDDSEQVDDRVIRISVTGRPDHDAA